MFILLIIVGAACFC
ncbi:YjcZ family sporulation protein [Bacillus paranthracis]|nr:sporulation protein YjcZ [Bacillus cereus]MBE5111123.1 YjcZ family sporulation protein [Bacillus paranthracis]OTX70914.1 hypothetical protein BK722_14105 [Bacillus thuringiensis serovar finitimus]OUB96435.1 hypothetical protein BK752_16775 [Bacillus thuringiensis serovar canadensis]OXL94539.1 hypothetical protein B6N65_22660 [Bacillus sp. KbaB1]